jgi:hypothetical protein
MKKEDKKDLHYWTLFFCEVCEKIKDEKERELVRKRITKKIEMFYKIISKEIASLKKIKK